MTVETKPICLDSFPEAEHSEAVPLEVYARVPNEHGGHYLHRKRWRTFAEVYTDTHKALYLRVCDKCGKEHPDKHDGWRDKPCKCGGEFQPLIDEYDSGPGRGRFTGANSEIADADEHIVDIVCYANVGGNEGYFANCGVLVRKNYGSDKRYVHLYHVKSFAGMTHVHDLVRRMMLATGVWPEWCERKTPCPA